jgi:hypothetical protein
VLVVSMAHGFSFVREGVRRLQDTVGQGKLRGALRVDQVYAKYQHERLDLRHPRGGSAKYLQRPLYEHYREWLQALADNVLTGELEQTMVRCMEAFNSAMSRATPIQYNNLRRSGNPRVYSNGRKIYDRAPHQRRLSARELRILRPHRGRR